MKDQQVRNNTELPTCDQSHQLEFHDITDVKRFSIGSGDLHVTSREIVAALESSNNQSINSSLLEPVGWLAKK